MDGPSWKKQKTEEGSKAAGHFRDRDNNNNNNDSFHKKSNKFGGGSLVSAQNQQTEEDWSIQEKKFDLEQHKAGAELRVREGRGKPLDIVYFYMGLASQSLTHTEKEKIPPPVGDPTMIFKSPTTDKELTDMNEKIAVFIELGKHIDFWKAMLTLCRDEIGNRRKSSSSSSSSSVSAVISNDVEKVFEGKSITELDTLETQIKGKLGMKGVDVEYWEGLLRKLAVHKSRAVITQIYDQIVRPSDWQTWTVVAPPPPNRIQQRQQKVNPYNPNRIIPTSTVIARPNATNNANNSNNNNNNNAQRDRSTGGDSIGSSVLIPLNSSSTTTTTTSSTTTSVGAANYIARMPASVAVAVDMPVPNQSGMQSGMTDFELRRKQLEKEAETLRNSKFVQDERTFTADELWQREADNGLDENEQLLLEEPIQQPQFEWAGKHKAVKPKYWCKLRRIPDWNRYNQTHYDLNNPPPRIIDSYRFSIFYPDLVDKTVNPSYFVEPSSDPDFNIVRFRAGAPYLDVAFKVYNLDWEFSHKKGFRCMYQNGVLRLYFHLRRYRYRR